MHWSHRGEIVFSKSKHHAIGNIFRAIGKSIAFKERSDFVSVDVPSLTWIIPLVHFKGKMKKVVLFAADVRNLQMESIFVPCTNMADTVFVPRNRRWLFSQGTDSISNFTSSFYNPVGLTSQEGLLYNPRQRFETVRRLSIQETRRASNHRRDTKDRSLAHGKMASKTVKNRYLSFS